MKATLSSEDLPMIIKELLDKKADQFNMEIELNGRIYEVNIFLMPQLQKVRTYSIDITERKQAEKEVKQLNAELLKRAAELKQLTVILRLSITPLHMIYVNH